MEALECFDADSAIHMPMQVLFAELNYSNGQDECKAAWDYKSMSLKDRGKLDPRHPATARTVRLVGTTSLSSGRTHGLLSAGTV
jgi:hypothetical protein